MQTYAFRLKPQDDLMLALGQWVSHQDIQAGCVLTAVGTLEQAGLKFAGRSVPRLLKRKFTIVSLVGTVSVQGVHLNLSVADSNGTVIGGQVAEGCLVYTTVEMVVGELSQYGFRREFDRHTGYLELKITEKPRVAWADPGQGDRGGRRNGYTWEPRWWNDRTRGNYEFTD